MMPPFKTFVDVFGGGGGLFFTRPNAEVMVYNDIGNVANFMKVMRDDGEELYRRLYQTPFSREEFELCSNGWPQKMDEGDMIEWARMWFTTINQGYSHEEHASSWHVAKQVNSARALRNHVNDIPVLMEKLGYCIIEHLDFEKLIPLYDLPTTLFYCDPPYYGETRVSQNNYKNEMPPEKHVKLLDMLQNLQAQVVLSGYDSALYNDKLSNWRTVRKTAKSAIQNSSSMENRGDRTEVLWVKEHEQGLWIEDQQANVAGISISASLKELVLTSREELV